MLKTGLDGVVAARTQLSSVDGEAGELVIGGYPLEELAGRATFEEAVHLLWYGALPTARELGELGDALASEDELPEATLCLLREASASRVPPMDALRMAVGTLDLDARSSGGNGGAQRDATLLRACAILRRVPAIVAAYWRLLKGEEVVSPRRDLGLAADYLYMLNGTPPTAEQVRALETYLVTVIDHGFNASTFTARVIMSTGSDLVSSLVGAVGALKGPLHGGAPGPALDMVFEIETPELAEPYLRRKLERGERLMGFGHRIYKVRDPRADVLAAAAERLYHADGDMALYELARAVEKKALELLEEYKPGRRLQTNVEFYTALLLHGLGFDAALFSPTFAVGRAAGWVAHCLEQQLEGRLIRPQSEYVGPQDRRWVPIEER